MDIAFLLDSSGSISLTNYQKMKDFIKAVAGSFSIGPGETFAGVILYGSDATTVIRFADHFSNVNFNNAVDNLPYLQGETRIDKALQLAYSELLTNRGGVRPGVAKAVVLLTDGRQSPAPDRTDLKEAAAPLLSTGVRIFAVGIGNDVDKRELQLIVEKPEDVIVAESFDELALRVRQVSIATCESAGTISGYNKII